MRLLKEEKYEYMVFDDAVLYITLLLQPLQWTIGYWEFPLILWFRVGDGVWSKALFAIHAKAAGLPPIRINLHKMIWRRMHGHESI